MPAFEDDVWELYGPDDWTQAHDLAAEMPDKLAELQELFLGEARKYNVLPLDDRRFERFNADLAGRPQLVRGTPVLLFGGMGRLSENSVVVTKNKSHAITAEILVPDGGAEGVIVSQEARSAASSSTSRMASPPTATTSSGSSDSRCTGKARSRRASTRCGWSSPTTAVGSARAVTSIGEQVSGRVDGTVPMAFSADETTDVGSDTATPVSDDYGPKDSIFTGKRSSVVQLDVDATAEDDDHLITAEERLRVAMARQSLRGFARRLPLAEPSSRSAQFATIRGRPVSPG